MIKVTMRTASLVLGTLGGGLGAGCGISAMLGLTVSRVGLQGMEIGWLFALLAIAGGMLFMSVGLWEASREEPAPEAPHAWPGEALDYDAGLTRR